MQVEIFCPECGELTEHVTVKLGREHLVRCEACGTVHPQQLERTKLSSLRVIVSAPEGSARRTIELPAEDLLAVGDEILVDGGVDEVVMVEVTSIELAGGEGDGGGGEDPLDEGGGRGGGEGLGPEAGANDIHRRPRQGGRALRRRRGEDRRR